jgi:hypothetical protein
MSAWVDEEFDKEFEEDWKNFWLDILITDGKFDEKKIKDEIHDFAYVLREVPKVYSHITNGQMSKPNYWSSEVISVADDVTTELCNESYDDGQRDLIEEVKIAVKNGYDLNREIELWEKRLKK